MNEHVCHNTHQNFSRLNNTIYCNAVFDGILCWNPTIAGTITNQTCPYSNKFNSSRILSQLATDCGTATVLGTRKRNQVAVRTCLNNGTWLSSRFSKNHSKGYTNYDNCVPEYGAALYKMCKEMVGCLEIVDRTRIIELVGLSVSMLSLVASLFIFYKYRILRNNRTKIHKNLFLAITVQVITRLLLYIDENTDMKILGETEYLCETCIVLLEYTKTAMFMWMFVEGLYLHNVITVTVFQEYSYVKLYFYIGWVVPLVMVMIWVFVMIFAVVTSGCWFLYSRLPHYWILEGPRYIVIIVNKIFLLNIIRVLVMKLRQSRTSEIEQVRKAVRAAIFLLPLMGIANILFLVDYRIFKKAWKFALWSYVTYFITTFQGFFVAVLYCFLNEEVRAAIRKSVATYLSKRNRRNFQRRNSVLHTGMSMGDSDI